MTLTPAAVVRFGRQIALPEIGPEGQERIGTARVALVGDGITIETAGRYLAAAGVTDLRRVSRAPGSTLGVQATGQNVVPWPTTPQAWLDAIAGATAVVRAGFEDDALGRVTVRLGIALVVARATCDAVDVISFRQQLSCPHGSLAVAAQADTAAESDSAAGVLAGTLAATELLWVLACPDVPPRARHLRLGLHGAIPVAQDLPWAPECAPCAASRQGIGPAS